MNQIKARIGLQQRMLPSYRKPFFEALAEQMPGKWALFTGLPHTDEAVDTNVVLHNIQHTLARNHHFFDNRLYLCWQSGFINWLESWQPDVLIVEANPRYLSTPAAIRWMHKRQRPVIAWGLGAPAAGKQIKSPLDALRRKWQRGFFSQFDAIIAYSRQGAEEYRNLGIDAGNIFVAANAVSPRPVHHLPERALQFSEGKPILLFVGRLQERKRVDLLIQACQALPEQLKPYLWIVGEGPVRADLEILARSVFPDTHFFGARQGKELEDIYRKADIFVLPGTGGLAVQQAMSYGLPVIVAEADGTQSDLVRRENGWVVPPGDVTALQKTIEQALTDIVRLRMMGKLSYQIVAEEINLENMVQVFYQVIYKVLEKRSCIYSS